MIELHEPTFIFTAMMFIAGILYGNYMFKKGQQDGANNVVNDLLGQRIIELDDDGMIVRAED